MTDHNSASTGLVENSAAAGRQVPLPMRVSVSLRAGVVLAAANIVCILILSWAWMHVRAQPKVISVTGSARRQIQSDLIVWSARISVADPDLTAAYDQLKTGTDKVLAYLKQHGVSESQTTVSAVVSSKRHARDAKGNETEKIVAYELSQSIEISSTDTARIAEVARQVTDLIRDGVYLESDSPKYMYTKLADLKIAMLADATRDATNRARQIADNSGAHLGAILDARMGVMQINAVHDDEVTGSGVNDTSSLVKEITAVVSARFALQ